MLVGIMELRLVRMAKTAKHFVSWCSAVINGIRSAKNALKTKLNLSRDAKHFTLVTANFGFLPSRSLVCHAPFTLSVMRHSK